MTKFRNLFIFVIMLITLTTCSKNRPYSPRPTLSLSTEYSEKTGNEVLVINFSEMVSQNLKVEFEIMYDDGIQVVHGMSMYIKAWAYRARISLSFMCIGDIPEGDTYITIRLVRAWGVCGDCPIGEPDQVKVKIK